MKKLTSWLLALVLMVVAIPACLAAVTTEATRVELEDLEISLEVPAGVYVFTADTDPLSGDWMLAGYGENGLDALDSFQPDDSGNVMAMQLVPEDQSFHLSISRQYNDQSRDYFNLNDVTEEQFQALLDSNTFEDAENGITAKAVAYDHDQVPFFRMDLTGGTEEEPIYETCYGTIVNGCVLSFDMYSNEELTQEQQALLQNLVDSVEILQFYEKPTQQEMMMQTILMFVPIVAIVLIIAAFLLSIRFKTKSQERKKNELTENLVAYRKKQAEKAMDPNYVMPPTLLENTTFCSDIAVKKFCQFHFFRKNIVQNSIFILLGIVSFVMGIRYDDANWILRIVLLGLGLYLAVQPFLSVDKMVKAEIRVYQRGRSREAHYAFREEDFRVSGLQSPVLYPYLQIVRAYESKEYFYLYYTDDRAYIVEKAGFTTGDAAALREILKKNLKKGCHLK